jgi:hypothetical protein
MLMFSDLPNIVNIEKVIFLVFKTARVTPPSFLRNLSKEALESGRGDMILDFPLVRIFFSNVCHSRFQ